MLHLSIFCLKFFVTKPTLKFRHNFFKLFFLNKPRVIPIVELFSLIIPQTLSLCSCLLCFINYSFLWKFWSQTFHLKLSVTFRAVENFPAKTYFSSNFCNQKLLLTFLISEYLITKMTRNFKPWMNYSNMLHQIMHSILCIFTLVTNKYVIASFMSKDCYLSLLKYTHIFLKFSNNLVKTPTQPQLNST